MSSSSHLCFAFHSPWLGKQILRKMMRWPCQFWSLVVGQGNVVSAPCIGKSRATSSWVTEVWCTGPGCRRGGSLTGGTGTLWRIRCPACSSRLSSSSWCRHWSLAAWWRLAASTLLHSRHGWHPHSLRCWSPGRADFRRHRSRTSHQRYRPPLLHGDAMVVPAFLKPKGLMGDG